MPLTDTQLQFLQAHVLRRNRTLGTEALDLATPLKSPSTVTLKGETDRGDTAHQYSQMLAALDTPPGASSDETGELENLRKAIRALLKEPILEPNLAEASIQLQALDTAVKRVQTQVEDRKRRGTERTELAQAVDEALQGLDAEAMEPERTQLPLDAEKIKSDLPAVPSEEQLNLARQALALLKQAVLNAATRVLEDRKQRAESKLDVLKRVGEATLSSEATGDETLQAKQLAADVGTLITADPPTADALKKAEDALTLLKDFVAKTNKDITQVRQARFALATSAGEKFSKLVTTAPKEYPDGKAELTQALEQLDKDLKPFLQWANVTTWEASVLEPVAQRIEPLGLQFEAFRQDVAKAVETIRLAAEAASKTIASPGGEAFSSGQVSHFEGLLKGAVDEANKDVLAATPHLEKMKALQKQALAVARVRNDLLRRLKLLPTPAPVGATPTEKDRWDKLREAAAKAADEVVDA